MVRLTPSSFAVSSAQVAVCPELELLPVAPGSLQPAANKPTAAGALADDERGLGDGMGAGKRIAPHAEDFEHPPAQCRKVEPDGGQRGCVVRRSRRVVEPDHAEFTGNTDLQVMGSTQ